MRLFGPSAFVATFQTSRGCASGFHHNHRHTSPSRLVTDEVNQLAERPVGYHAVEPLAGFAAVADTSKVLQRDEAPWRACNNVNNLAADLVVDVLSPSAFSRLAGLDFADVLPAATHTAILLMSPTGMLEAFASPELDDTWPDQRCQLRYPEVYAKARTVTDGRRIGSNTKGQIDVPVAVSFIQFGIPIGEG